MLTFRIDEAYLIGSWCSAALWGIFSFLLVIAIVQIVHLYIGGRMNRSKWITASAMATLHAEAIEFWKGFMYITSMIIADMIVVWRYYVVWQSNRQVITLLSFLLFSTIATGAGSLAQHFLPATTYAKEAIDFGYALYSVSLATNVITSLLTVGRIWWQARVVSHTLGSSYQSTYRTLILVLIESGSIIAVAKVIEFILYIIVPAGGREGPNGLYVIFDMMPQINGIMPTLIIITVNAGKTITDVQQSTKLSTFDANGTAVCTPIISFAPNGGRHENMDRDGQTVRLGPKDAVYEHPDGIHLGATSRKADSDTSSSGV